MSAGGAQHLQAPARAQPGAARTITAADLASLFQNRGPAHAVNRPPPAQPEARRPPSENTGATGALRQPTVSEPLLQNMVDMGFDRRKARAALLRNDNNLDAAVDWLAGHWEKPDSFYNDLAPTQPVATAATPSATVGRSHLEPSPQLVKYLEIFEPVLRAIALVAVGDTRPNKSALDVRLRAMENDGWKRLSSTVQRIWSGERDDRALTAQLDENTSFIVSRILQLTRNSMVETGELDFYVKNAIPKDPEIEASTLAPLRPWVQRIARTAARQTAQSFGLTDVAPSSDDLKEDEAVNRFVSQLDARGWQLRTPVEMLCAGVRSDSDVLECIAALPNGLPDDNSARLVHAILEELARMG